MLKRLSHEFGITILISSHILSEIENIADVIGFMDNGVLIEEITKEELFERRNKFVEFEVSNINSAVDILNDVGLMQDRDFKFDGWGRIHLYTHLELRGKLNALFVNSGIDVEKVNLCEENLEEFFTRVISNN